MTSCATNLTAFRSAIPAHVTSPRGRGIRTFLLLAILLLPGTALRAQTTTTADTAVAAMYRDYAVITTTCETLADAGRLAKQIFAEGGIVSTILTPKIFFGWIPEHIRPAVTALDRVTGVAKTDAMGKSAAFLQDAKELAPAMEHFRRAKSGDLPSDDQVHQPSAVLGKCFEQGSTNPLSQFGERIGAKIDSVEKATGRVDEAERAGVRDAIQGLIPRGIMTGTINVDVFMLESTGASSVYNWTYAEESRVMSDFIRGFDFWSRQAARYGRAVTFHPTWFRPSSTSAVNVPYEPVRVSKDNDWQIVRSVMLNLGFDEPWGNPVLGGIGAFFSGGLCIPCDLAVVFAAMDDGITKESVRVIKWNADRTDDLGVDQSYCAFVKYQPASSADDVFRAYAWVFGTGWIGGSITIPVIDVTIPIDITVGMWIMVDAKDGRFPAVVSHESGHIFGAPDEYRENDGDADCPQPGYALRGESNRNCFATNMNSVDAMMRSNSLTNLNQDQFSSATPVFIGWSPAPARTIRFRTIPSGIPMTLPIAIRQGPSITSSTDLYLGLGYRIYGASVPASYDIGGTTYYFDTWLENGSPVLYGLRRDITIGSTVNEYAARYTTSGGGITASNSTLEARLSTGIRVSGSVRQYTPGVVLVWRSTLTDSRSYYDVQMRDAGGSWAGVPDAYVISHSSGRYCYADIRYIGGSPLSAGTSYTFRVVPTRAGTAGTPSNTATITTRPSTPAAGTFGYDGNESNDTQASATSLSSGSADSVRVIDAALVHIRGSEFGFSFDADVYRIQASGLTGQSLSIVLTVKPGSSFTPSIEVRPVAGGTTRRGIRSDDGSWRTAISSDGEYYLTVTAARSTDDPVDETSGIGAWGEYSLQLRRIPLLLFANPLLCLECTAVRRIMFGGGLIVPDPPPDFPFGRLFALQGTKLSSPVSLPLRAEPDAGFVFSGWEGDLKGNTQPASLSLDPAKPPTNGEATVMALFTPLPQGTYELVVDIPRAWQGVLGPPQRYRGKSGEEFDVSLPDAAANGFDFKGWDGVITDADVVSPPDWRTSTAIRIRLTRNMWIRPFIVPRPCIPGGLQPFQFTMHVITAKKNVTTMEFGMQPGAGDGLEAGQTELPPVPVSGVPDARFINIPGTQGSLTDIRAVKAPFTFVGRVQPGDGGDPVHLDWDPIPASLPGTFTLQIGGSPLVNMRSQTSMSTQVGSFSTFSITVTEDTCRELPKDVVTVQIGDLDVSQFPYVRGHFCVTDKKGNPILTVRKADVMLFETPPGNPNGQPQPAYLLDFGYTNECYSFGGILDNGAPRDPGHKTRGLVLTVGVPDPAGQDSDGQTFDVPVSDPGQDTTNGNGRPNTAYAVTHGSGWQLVSLPLMTTDAAPGQVFRDHTIASQLFGFDPNAGYAPATQMDMGKGYWLKFSDAGSPSMVNGLERTRFELSGLPGVGQSAADGWNLIGSISYDVNRSAITESPSGAILSLFLFDNGYKPAAVLSPGKGFWVKLQPGATLTLNKSFTGGGSGGSASKSTVNGTAYDALIASLPRLRDWTVSDAAGGDMRLFTTPAAAYDALDRGQRTLLALPPEPPAGAFDARFSTGGIASGDGQALTIMLQGTPPFSLSTPALDGSTAEYEVRSGDGRLIGTVRGASGGLVSIPPSAAGTGRTTVTIQRLRGTDDAAPGIFRLAATFPNPMHAGSTAGMRVPFTLGTDALVDIRIVDLLGRTVSVLASTAFTAGRHELSWNGRTESGDPVPAGMYVVRMQSGTASSNRPILIVK